MKSVWNRKRTDATAAEVSHDGGLFTIHYGPAHRVVSSRPEALREYAAVNTMLIRHDQGDRLERVKDY